MRVLIATPAPRGDRGGNRITALRWAAMLRSLGHRVRLVQESGSEPCDALIALHARKSHASIVRFREQHPGGALVVALTGTDVYGDMDRDTQRSLELADRIVALQPRAIDRLPPELRPKVRAIFQSAPRSARKRPQPIIAVLGHLRRIKDPFRAAEAARLLPAESALIVVHAGAALEPELADRARREMLENPRYRWLGAVSRAEVRALIAESCAVVLSSLAEGGANVVCEAIAGGVPVLASRIEGTLGQLGDEYPGWFAPGDTRALAELMLRAESEPKLFADEIARLAPLFAPERERALWASLIGELDGTRPRSRIIELPSPRASFADDVRKGLSAEPKHLSCSYFYDEEGSHWFQKICELDEYYIPRAEREILERRSEELVSLAPVDAAIVELGSGDGAKTRLILDAFHRRYGHVVYQPVDIAKEMLEESAARLLGELGGLEVDAIAAEYERGLAHLLATARDRPKLILFLGSNIGNFYRPAAAAFLTSVRATMGPHDLLLAGIDLKKARSILEPAYDDPKGVTAGFNLNLLLRINRELGGRFDLSAFAHRAEYQEDEGRIAMDLESLRDQDVGIDALGRSFRFAAGERIHTEYSYKYSFAEIDQLAAQAGLHVVRRWTDTAGLFCSTLMRG